ncbi:MAG: DUF433 domain-containing protein [Chloroflexi bacterium]|nr:DUF433 domain-containing protein [Chloroflexota bacterium]MDA8188244.1 DUF433 domain-containing protein [Dehalococcoidales bacterium]
MAELVAFSAEHVCQLTGLSMRQLRYWDSQGFFAPQYADECRRRPFGRIYSFKDVVGLRTLALLLNKYHVSLQELRKLGAWLKDRYDSPWASLTFYVRGRRVFFEDDAGIRRTGVLPFQTAMPIEMDRIQREMREAAEKLRERKPEQIGRIIHSRYILHNADSIAGTRISTVAIWNFSQAGYSIDAIIKEYPRLTPEDVRAAIAHEVERRRKQAG